MSPRRRGGSDDGANADEVEPDEVIAGEAGGDVDEGNELDGAGAGLGGDSGGREVRNAGLAAAAVSAGKGR